MKPLRISLSFATKLIEKIFDPSHTKEYYQYYQSFLKSKNKDIVKHSAICYATTKHLENQILLLINQF